MIGKKKNLDHPASFKNVIMLTSGCATMLHVDLVSVMQISLP